MTDQNLIDVIAQINWTLDDINADFHLEIAFTGAYTSVSIVDGPIVWDNEDYNDEELSIEQFIIQEIKAYGESLTYAAKMLEDANT